jgi:hypothetical protein
VWKSEISAGATRSFQHKDGCFGDGFGVVLLASGWASRSGVSVVAVGSCVFVFHPAREQEFKFLGKSGVVGRALRAHRGVQRVGHSLIMKRHVVPPYNLLERLSTRENPKYRASPH